MEYLLSKLLFLSLAGAAAVGLTWIAVRAGQNRLSKRWSYYIWLLPLLAFVLPMPGVQLARTELPVNLPAYQEATTPAAAPDTVQPVQEAAPAQNPPQAAQPEQAAAAPAVRQGAGWPAKAWWLLAAMVWAAGALAIVCYRAVLRARFARRLRVICEAPGEWETDMFLQLCAEMGIKKPPAFWRVPAGVSPFITGIRRPRIVLPDTVTQAELPLVLRHELTHYKRHDLLYRAAVYAVSAIHWFNPAVYVMQRLVEREMELSCDEAALASMEYEQRRQYGLSVLMLMKRNRMIVPGTAFLSESRQDMQKRMEGIMTKKTYGLWAKISAIALAAVMMCSTTALSAGISHANPVKNTYGVKYDASIGKFTYLMETPDEEVLADNTGSGQAAIRASFVNTPLQKSFYASVEAPEYRLYGVTQTQEHRDANITVIDNAPRETISAQAEIRMDQLLLTVNDGRSWIGRFTVTLNGETILEQAYGVLTDVPSGNQKNMTRLNVYDDTAGKVLSLYSMRFDMDSEAILEGAKADGALREAFFGSAEYKTTPLCQMTALSLPQSTCPWFVQPDETTDEELSTVFYYNTALGKLDWAGSMANTPYGIETDLADDFTFTGDSAHGRFFVLWHNQRVAEFTGTLSGLNGSAGDTLALRSDDGAYSAELVFWETEQPIEVTEPTEPPATLSEAFRQGAERQWRHITTADFPFTVTLNPDKKSVTLAYKEESGFEGWTASMATYPSSADEPYIWEDIGSNQGQNTFTFSVLDTGVRHYINFSAYNTLPNAKITEGELIFKLLDGELFYTNGTQTTYSHPTLTGEDALPYMMEFCNPLRRLQR